MRANWMSRFWRIGFLISLLASGSAFADNLEGPIRAPAIPVSHPTHALLISIAHAGNRLVAVGENGLIIYSDDNGQSWKQASVPTSETITTASFADAKDGWAAGAQGVILHTVDGGASWQLQLTGTQVLPLMTAAAAQFVASNPNAPTAANAVRRASIFAAAGPNKPFLSITTLSPQSAIVYGAYRMTVMTKDGGKTWVDWSLNIGDPLSHAIYDAEWIGKAIYLTGEAGIVLRSTDNGQSFQLLNAPDSSTMFGILGTPQGSLLTFGVAGNVFISHDQGKTWSQASGSSSADLTAGLVLKSGAILITAEDGTIFESKDGGQSFAVVPLGEGMALYGMTQAANGDVVFVGSNGIRVEPASQFD